MASRGVRGLSGFFCTFTLFVCSALHAQQNGTVTYVYTDPQGTPLAEADASGNVTKTFDYTPYGTTALGTSPNGPGYTGHVNDPETNLVYMQGRYYDPASGHFLSVDPTKPAPGNTMAFNRYDYANNNPIVNQDPDGKDCTRSGTTFTCTPTMNGKPLTYLPSTPPLPAPSNWPQKMDSSSMGHHEYIYETPIGDKSPQSVAKAIAQDPVPNANGKPATPQGTQNSAGPSSGARAVLGAVANAVGLGDSSVKSYTFQDSKGNTWEMNVTENSHTLSPGYVLRGVAQGNAVSYGEGTALKQDLGQASDVIMNNVWIDQNQRNINEAH